MNARATHRDFHQSMFFQLPRRRIRRELAWENVYLTTLRFGNESRPCRFYDLLCFAPSRPDYCGYILTVREDMTARILTSRILSGSNTNVSRARPLPLPLAQPLSLPLAQPLFLLPRRQL